MEGRKVGKIWRKGRVGGKEELREGRVGGKEDSEERLQANLGVLLSLFNTIMDSNLYCVKSVINIIFKR